MRRAAFWALVAATLAVYAIMIFWSLPRVADAAGGLAPFDMRPSGYTLDEARAFLAALDADGSAFYRDVQLRLDSLYPALLAAMLGLALLRLWRGVSPVLAGALAAVALAGGIADYIENACIRRMLSLGADGLTAPVAEAASAASRGKAALTTVAMVALLAGLGRAGWKRWRA